MGFFKSFAKARHKARRRRGKFWKVDKYKRANHSLFKHFL